MLPEDTAQARWFTDHLQPHEPMLRAWLRSRFPSEPDLDDLLQESYLRVLQAHKRGEIRSPKAFLFATARNLALDRAQRRRIIRLEPLVESEALTVLDEDAGIPETVVHNQELEMLTEAVQSLPERCRQIFTLRKVYGLSQKEIGQRLGISPFTVSAQLTIAVHKCTEYMLLHREGGK